MNCLLMSTTVRSAVHVHRSIIIEIGAPSDVLVATKAGKELIRYDLALLNALQREQGEMQVCVAIQDKAFFRRAASISEPSGLKVSVRASNSNRRFVTHLSLSPLKEGRAVDEQMALVQMAEDLLAFDYSLDEMSIVDCILCVRRCSDYGVKCSTRKVLDSQEELEEFLYGS